MSAESHRPFNTSFAQPSSPMKKSLYISEARMNGGVSLIASITSAAESLSSMVIMATARQASWPCLIACSRKYARSLGSRCASRERFQVSSAAVSFITVQVTGFGSANLDRLRFRSGRDAVRFRSPRDSCGRERLARPVTACVSRQTGSIAGSPIHCHHPAAEHAAPRRRADLPDFLEILPPFAMRFFGNHETLLVESPE